MAETRRRRNCELCDGEAAVYCPSDSAFLCRSCDSKVHSANFLVARHLRSPLCSNCGIADSRHFSGVRIVSSAANLCRSCSPEAKSSAGEGENEIADSLSSSSSCISSTTDTGDDAASETVKERSGGKAVAVAVDEKVEGVLVNWSRRMEVDERRVVPAAVEFLGGCMTELTVLPFRVCLTASFWVALRVCCSPSATCQNMRRLEQISGVPAKLVLATQSRLARVLKRRRSRVDHEEGWAEC